MSYKLQPHQQEIVEWLEKNGPAKTREIADMLGRDTSPTITLLNTLYYHNVIKRRQVFEEHEGIRNLWSVNRSTQ